MSEQNITNKPIQMPEKVRSIIQTLQENGYEGYAVGGCVRDSVLSRTPDDWDITTSAKPQQVKALFKHTIDTGIQHGTVTVMLGKDGFEVTTYRIDGEYKDGRHPETVEFSGNLSEDLRRRDFTINAMAYNEATGFVDLYDGLGDIERKVIRCVGEAKERFTEDALRMMRAIRFSAQLGFDIEDKTYQAITELAPSIAKVSMERVQVELVKTLMSDNPDYVMYYQKTGLFDYILPKISEMLSGKYSKSILTMLKKSEKTPIMRYAALLNYADESQAKAILKDLKLDNYTVKMVSRLVGNTDKRIEENEPAVREALHCYGRELLEAMLSSQDTALKAGEELLGVSMTAKRTHLVNVRRLLLEIIQRGDCVSVRDLDITGNDLMEYGLSGAAIGKTLEGLLHIVIENPKLNEKSALLAMIEHLDI